MTQKKIVDLEEGEPFDLPMLLQLAEIRETSGGKPYLAATVRDDSAAIELRFWDYRADKPPAEPGDLVMVAGTVDAYQGELQLNAGTISTDLPSLEDLDPADFVASANDKIDYIFGHVTGEIDRHCAKPLRDLLHDVVWQLDETPAAQTKHHARYHGLVEHVRSMVLLAGRIVEHYGRRYEAAPRLDLVIAGCILHDAGKIYELSGPIGTEYTRDGELEGHIALGLDILDDAFEATDTCPLEHADLRRHLRHLILSHHGRQEWGSPVEPKTPEAVLLHQIDMLDSRMDPVCSALEEAGEGDERVRTSTGDELILAGGGGANE